jgi:hypothetical protein
MSRTRNIVRPDKGPGNPSSGPGKPGRRQTTNKVVPIRPTNDLCPVAEGGHCRALTGSSLRLLHSAAAPGWLIDAPASKGNQSLRLEASSRWVGQGAGHAGFRSRPGQARHHRGVTMRPDLVHGHGSHSRPPYGPRCAQRAQRLSQGYQE